MSKYKEILEQIKKVAFSEEKVEEVSTVVEENKFAAVSLADGTVLNVEPDVQPGAAVTIEDPEQGFVPVPDGSYQLEDGRVLVVVGGAIENIEEVAAEEEVAEEEMENETKEAPVMNEKEIRKIIESVETHFASEIQTLRAELAEFKSQAKETNELFVSAIE